MAGKNEAQASARLHQNVVLPLVDALRRRGTLVKIAFCTIQSVLSDTYALVEFESGGVAALRYGFNIPTAGERWRCLDLGGGLILDDLAVAPV